MQTCPTLFLFFIVLNFSCCILCLIPFLCAFVLFSISNCTDQSLSIDHVSGSHEQRGPVPLKARALRSREWLDIGDQDVPTCH